MIRILICTLAVLLSAARPAFATEIRTEKWIEKPIPITLPVEKPIVLHLPAGNVRPGIPPELLGKVDVYPAENRIYLTAKTEFPPTLVSVRYHNDDREYLFYLRGTKVATPRDIRVIDGTVVPEEVEPGLADEHHRIDVNKLLVRYASQMLYAPRRLMPSEPSIKRAAVIPRQIQALEKIQTEAGSTCAATGSLIAKPIAAWRSGSTFVTAVRLENTGDSTITVDPRGCHLQGNFLTATPQHSVLLPKFYAPCDPGEGGTAKCQPTYKHVTTIYYTSAAPFWEVVHYED